MVGWAKFQNVDKISYFSIFHSAGVTVRRTVYTSKMKFMWKSMCAKFLSDSPRGEDGYG